MPMPLPPLPLTDALRLLPEEAGAQLADGTIIPLGYLMHAAAQRIEELEAQLRASCRPIVIPKQEKR